LARAASASSVWLLCAQQLTVLQPHGHAHVHEHQTHALQVHAQHLHHLSGSCAQQLIVLHPRGHAHVHEHQSNVYALQVHGVGCLTSQWRTTRVAEVLSWRCGTTKSGKRKVCCQFPPAHACNQDVVKNLREQCQTQARELLSGLPKCWEGAGQTNRGSVWETSCHQCMGRYIT